MKSIWRRLAYYGIGLLLGVIFVTVLFGSRACSWLPENRIKSSLFSQIIVIDTTVNRFSNAIENDSVFIQMVIDAKVNFGLSQRKGEPKAYYFTYENKNKPPEFFQITFETDGVVGICEPIGENKMSSASFKDQWLPTIHVPGDENFISIHEDAKLSFQDMNLSEKDIYKGLQRNGIVKTVSQEDDGDGRKIYDFKLEWKGVRYMLKGRIFQQSLEVMYIALDN